MKTSTKQTSKASHTPGPWNTDGENVYHCPMDKNHDSVDSDQHIAKIYVPTDTEGPEQEGLANARLIAAAPELLEALKELKSILSQNHEKFTNHSGFAYKMYRADEAIAKAEGR